MVALGLILLVVSVLLGTGIALSNTEPVTAEAFGVSLSNVSLGGLFLVGVCVGAVAMLGLALVLTGAARKRAKKHAIRREVEDARGQKESLAEENARLKRELDTTSRSEPYPGEPGHEGVGHSEHGKHRA